jgi:hypothetical protein
MRTAKPGLFGGQLSIAEPYEDAINLSAGKWRVCDRSAPSD